MSAFVEVPMAWSDPSLTRTFTHGDRVWHVRPASAPQPGEVTTVEFVPSPPAAGAVVGTVAARNIEQLTEGELVESLTQAILTSIWNGGADAVKFED
jgi:hypothetical protein